MRALPPGAGVVWRAFGQGTAAQGRRLMRLARARGLILLVGADAGLAARIGADGVHLPERLAHRAGRLRRRRPDWILTAAAHSDKAVRRAARRPLDAVFLSPVFPSRSPSAGAPMGPQAFAAIARAARIRVMALGGVTAETAPRLLTTGAAGIAAVEGLL